MKILIFTVAILAIFGLVSGLEQDSKSHDAITCNACKIAIHALDAYLTDPANEEAVSWVNFFSKTPKAD